MLRSLGAPETILPVVLHHHERWDGSGYPTGRKEKDIPLEARVLCVADSFDAMTSNRPYRAPWSPEDALEELDTLRGEPVRPRARRRVRQGVGRSRPGRPRLAARRSELILVTASD